MRQVRAKTKLEAETCMGGKLLIVLHVGDCGKTEGRNPGRH